MKTKIILKNVIIFAIGLILFFMEHDVLAQTYNFKIKKINITKTKQNLAKPFSTLIMTPTGEKMDTEATAPPKGNVFIIVQGILNFSDEEMRIDGNKDFVMIDGLGNERISYRYESGGWIKSNRGTTILTSMWKKKMKNKKDLLYIVPENALEGSKIQLRGREYPLNIKNVGPGTAPEGEKANI